MENIEEQLISSRKEIPKNHKIEARYQSYERAKDYIKHISRVFDNTLQKSAEYDSSCIESLNFKSKLPQLNGKYKLSSFPTSQISKELSSKIALINAYNHLSDLPLSNSKTKHKTSLLSPIKNHKRLGKNEIKFSFTNNDYNDLCSICKLSRCRCHKSPVLKKTSQRIVSPELKKSALRDSFVITSKSNNYFAMKNPRQDKVSSSFEDKILFITPRKLNLTALNKYQI